MARSAGKKQKIIPHIPGTLEEITRAVLSLDPQFIQKQKQKNINEKTKSKKSNKSE